jgi:hypothetical protein
VRTKQASDDDQTALLEFMTSAEAEFSHRNGAAT